MHLNISLTMLNNRIKKFYRNPSHNHSTYAYDLKSHLLEHADKISNNSEESTTGLNVSNYVKIVQHITSNKPYQTSNTNRASIKELSNYYKSRSSNTEPHKTIDKKLKQSTLEHINAAFRSARNGDSVNSKMHIEIANSSCKELAHFINKEDYIDFIESIKKDLSELKN